MNGRSFPCDLASEHCWTSQQRHTALATLQKSLLRKLPQRRFDRQIIQTVDQHPEAS